MSEASSATLNDPKLPCSWLESGEREQSKVVEPFLDYLRWCIHSHKIAQLVGPLAHDSQDLLLGQQNPASEVAGSKRLP